MACVDVIIPMADGMCVFLFKHVSVLISNIVHIDRHTTHKHKLLVVPCYLRVLMCHDTTKFRTTGLEYRQVSWQVIYSVVGASGRCLWVSQHCQGRLSRGIVFLLGF